MASENIQIERQWFARVSEAQTCYQQAADYQLRTIDERDQPLIEPADGNYAAEQANRAAQLAMGELVRCQQILVKLLLQDETPPTDDRLIRSSFPPRPGLQCRVHERKLRHGGVVVRCNGKCNPAPHV